MTATGSKVAPPPQLLFDQNLAPSLPQRLADLYPGSTHVRDVGLSAADDEAIWSHALDGGYIIVMKEDDFRQRSFLRGARARSRRARRVTDSLAVYLSGWIETLHSQDIK